MYLYVHIRFLSYQKVSGFGFGVLFEFWVVCLFAGVFIYSKTSEYEVFFTPAVISDLLLTPTGEKRTSFKDPQKTKTVKTLQVQICSYQGLSCYIWGTFPF